MLGRMIRRRIRESVEKGYPVLKWVWVLCAASVMTDAFVHSAEATAANEHPLLVAERILFYVAPCLLSNALYLIRHRRPPNSIWLWFIWQAYPLVPIAGLWFLSFLPALLHLPVLEAIVFSFEAISLPAVLYSIWTLFLFLVLLAFYHWYFKHLEQ